MSNLKNNLKPNAIIKGPLFQEEIKIAAVIPMGDVIKIMGKGLKTGLFYEPVLNDEHLSKLEILPEKEPFDEDPSKFRLGIEAL